MTERAHRGQRRANGDRYIRHPIEVATIVADHGGTVPAICAALLHDVIEDAATHRAHLQREFGPEIAALVEAMTDRAARTGTIVDRELLLVTVADRLHNLRTLRRLPAASRHRTSLDTLAFHVPLAYRLNVPAVAAEMTDLACSTLDSLSRSGTALRWERLSGAARADILAAWRHAPTAPPAGPGPGSRRD